MIEKEERFGGFEEKEGIIERIDISKKEKKKWEGWRMEIDVVKKGIGLRVNESKLEIIVMMKENER